MLGGPGRREERHQREKKSYIKRGSKIGVRNDKE